LSEHLKKWADRIDRKVKKQRSIAGMTDTLEKVIRIQKSQNKAFQNTIGNVEGDFGILQGKVEKLEERVKTLESNSSV